MFLGLEYGKRYFDEYYMSFKALKKAKNLENKNEMTKHFALWLNEFPKILKKCLRVDNVCKKDYAVPMIGHFKDAMNVISIYDKTGAMAAAMDPTLLALVSISLEYNKSAVKSAVENFHSTHSLLFKLFKILILNKSDLGKTRHKEVTQDPKDQKDVDGSRKRQKMQ